jgi:D-glucosaminate-6-phosphate ammonia-lyase
MAVAERVPTQIGIYERLGVQPFINASGHNTAQGGSLMPPEVLAAMAEAARAHVPLPALQDAVGAHIAHVVGAPAAAISTGAAAAILLGAAACLTGTDVEKAYDLPETAPGARNEILVWASPRPNYMYQACRTAGGQLMEVGSLNEPIAPEDFKESLSDRSAAILLVLASLDEARRRIPSWEAFLQEVAADAAKYGVPVLVDAASELPPRNLVGKLLGLGASGVIVSGGKAIRGPQSTGLLFGGKDLIAAATVNGAPRSSVGRPLKVGKEELCGLAAAVDRFFSMDEAAQLADWRQRSETIVAAVEGAVGIRAEVIEGQPGYGRPPLTPKAVLHLDGGAPAVEALHATLAQGEPAIQALRQGSDLIFNPMSTEPGDAETIAARLRAVLH